MPSRTSFFKTLLKSDWRHYWPVAFVYTGAWIIAQPVSLWQNTRYQNPLPMALRMESQMANHQAAIWLCAFCAICAAMAVWSYLMKSASTQFMHALPATRRIQFAAHFTAGFSMMTAAHILTCFATIGVMALRGAALWGAALRWLAVAELTALFFFGLATICCIITGWLLAAPVFYGGLNCVFIVLASLVQELMVQCRYWGYHRGDFPGIIHWLTPVFRMTEHYRGTYRFLDNYDYGMYVANPKTLSVAAIYGAVGLVLAVCAYLLYEKRPSETAGDAVSFRWLRPIVKWVISLCGGMGLGLFFVSLFLGEQNIVLCGASICIFGILCFIAVEMLLQKSYRVFRRGLFIGCGALCAVLVALCAVLNADVFGYQDYLPPAEKVDRVFLYTGSGPEDTAMLTDDAHIRQVLELHQALTEMPEDERWIDRNDGTGSETYFYLDLSYTMKNGTSVYRIYNFVLPEGGEIHHMLNELYNDPAMRQQLIFPEYEAGGEATVTGGSVDLYRYDDQYGASYEERMDLTKEQAKTLYVTLGREAAEQGTWDVVNNRLQANIDFENYADQGFFVYTHVNLDCCPKTLQLLEEYGMMTSEG